VVFPDWKSVETWQIPLPSKLTKVLPSQRVVYFLGPLINFAVVPAMETAIRAHAKAPFDTATPPWGGWPMTSRWGKNLNSKKLREQWVEACDEARSMLDSASKLHSLRQRKELQASEGGVERQESEGGVERQPAARQRAQSQPTNSRAVPKRAAKAGGEGGFKVVGRRVEVWWDGEQCWFAGLIACYCVRTGRHLIKYDDGDEENLHLRKHRLRWLEQAPAPSNAPSGEGEGSVVLQKVCTHTHTHTHTHTQT
jgi:hypothetical protein